MLFFTKFPLFCNPRCVFKWCWRERNVYNVYIGGTLVHTSFLAADACPTFYFPFGGRMNACKHHAVRGINNDFQIQTECVFMCILSVYLGDTELNRVTFPTSQNKTKERLKQIYTIRVHYYYFKNLSTLMQFIGRKGECVLVSHRIFYVGYLKTVRHMCIPETLEAKLSFKCAQKCQE